MARIQTALLSVSNKRGVIELARALADAGVEILSTGGTARALRGAEVEVTDVSAYTGSPEVMDGRVKTLHPRVHGGILMRDTIGDRTQLTEIGGKAIDLVVCNLYPFEDTVARDAPHEEIIENIDIGGPSMIRSAAKNHARVAVVVDPADYPRIVEALTADDGPSSALRGELARKAFTHTAAYDAAIARYLTSFDDEGKRAAFPGTLALTFEKAYDLRYGENPHQQGAFYVERNAERGSLALAEPVGAGGKQLSYNNLVDVEAALDAVRELDTLEGAGAVVLKHTNPCGMATGDTLVEAYEAARAGDPLSAFGGIVALNRKVDAATAASIKETFIECVVAPGFDDEALELLKTKKRLRLLATGEWLGPEHTDITWKRIGGGLVVQERDGTAASEVQRATVATERAPTDEERAAMELAWRACKHVKSNAIVFAKPRRVVGVGAGQMSRVVAVELAAKKAGDESKGAVMASDAFFPFADGVEAAIAAGVTAVVQPGGSKRDEEVIAAANAAGIAMIMTGVRHFRH